MIFKPVLNNKKVITGYLFAITSSFFASLFFIPYKKALETISADQFVFALYLVSLIINITPLVLRTGLKIKRPVFNKPTIIVAFSFAILSVVGNFVNGLSLREIDPAITVVIQRTQVIMVIFMGWFFLREKIKASTITGALLAISGIVIISLSGEAIRMGHLSGVCYALVGAICFSSVQIIVKYFIDQINPISVNVIRLLFGVIILAMFPGNIQGLFEIEADVWKLIVLAAFGGTTISRICSMYALKHIPVSKATVLSMLTPIFTLIISWIIWIDFPSKMEIIGGTVILIGIAFPLVPVGFLRVYKKMPYIK